jgi:hypothetical protein
MIRAQTSLPFHPLTILVDPPDILVGRVDIESYAAFPEDGVALLKQLQAGMSLQKAQTWYLEQYGEAIDMADFIETLRELHFLQEEGEEIGRVSSASAFWQRVGQAAFAPFAWLIYGGIVGMSIFVMIALPYLRPANGNIFFTPYISLLELGLFCGQFPGMLFHEGFHMLAGLRLGIPSRLRIGRRLYFLVFETRLSGLWSVPRRQRYLPFLAGMLGDVLWFSVMTIMAGIFYTSGVPFSPGSFFRAMAFLTMLRLIWQFYFYLETDIYYVLTTALHCVNLQQTTRQFLLQRLSRLLAWKSALVDEDQWNPRDRQLAPWYAPLFLGGYLFSTATLLFIGVPVGWQFLQAVVAQLFSQAVFTSLFWNTLLFLGINVFQVGLLAFLVFRDIRQARMQARQKKLRMQAIYEPGRTDREANEASSSYTR